MVFSGMSLGIKVAELNTLSDGTGITGIWFFMRWKIQMNYVNLPTSRCQRIVAVRDIATEALSASLESGLTSDIPIKLTD